MTLLSVGLFKNNIFSPFNLHFYTCRLTLVHITRLAEVGCCMKEALKCRRCKTNFFSATDGTQRLRRGLSGDHLVFQLCLGCQEVRPRAGKIRDSVHQIKITFWDPEFLERKLVYSCQILSPWLREYSRLWHRIVVYIGWRASTTTLWQCTLIVTDNKYSSLAPTPTPHRPIHLQLVSS